MTRCNEALATTITVFTDGSCRGNPGPGGWAATIQRGDDRALLQGAELETTNNRMELMAAIAALEHLEGEQQVSLTTDSEYLRQGITQWIHAWRRNGWRTASKRAVKNQDLWKRLDQASGRHHVRWHWVRGHSGHPENECVDQAANAAIDALLAARSSADA